MNELVVLRTVALKGRASAEAIADATGLALADIVAITDPSVAVELLKETPAGLRLQPEGRDRLATLLADERANVDQSAMELLYDEFGKLNTASKAIFTDWQVRDGSPNDHTDPAYDATVLGRLDDVHRDILPLVDRIAGLVSRAARYRERFEAAQAKYAAGERAFVTSPMVDSYHTVWFELHEDLISWAGLTRSDEAAAGRAD